MEKKKKKRFASHVGFSLLAMKEFSKKGVLGRRRSKK